MTARTAKQSVTSEDLLHVMGTRDKLLLAQLVHEFGCKDWTAIANLFNKHPLINLPSGVATKKSCRDVYIALMKEEGNDWCILLLRVTRLSSNMSVGRMRYPLNLRKPNVCDVACLPSDPLLCVLISQGKRKAGPEMACRPYSSAEGRATATRGTVQVSLRFSSLRITYKCLFDLRIFLEEVRSIQEGRLPSAEADAIAPVEDKKRKGKGPPPTASLRRSTRSGARPSEPPQPEASPSHSRHSQTPSIVRLKLSSIQCPSLILCMTRPVSHQSLSLKTRKWSTWKVQTSSKSKHHLVRTGCAILYLH